MLRKLIDPDKIEALKSLINNARNIVITCHVSPDGDAVGSTLALQHIMASMGKKANVITPDLPPKSLGFIPGIHRLITAASQKPDEATRLVNDADLIFCLDYNALMRLDKLEPLIRGSKAPKVLIDHHLDPEDFAKVAISVPQASSTCYLLFLVLEAAGLTNLIDVQTAEMLYIGMMTDTGSFTYNSNDPGLYRVISRLLEIGIDKDRLYRQVFNTESESRIRLCSYALYRKMQIFPAHSLALITLSKAELDEFAYVKGDTESLVNRPLAIPSVCWSIFMRQDEDNFVKVSARSKGNFPVNKVCEQCFGGGGHLNAAGGEFTGTLDRAVDTLMTNISSFDKYLSDNQSI